MDTSLKLDNAFFACGSAEATNIIWRCGGGCLCNPKNKGTWPNTAPQLDSNRVGREVSPVVSPVPGTPDQCGGFHRMACVPKDESNLL